MSDWRHSSADFVRRPLVPAGAEGGVEQRFDSAIALRGEGCYVRQFLRFRRFAGISAASAGLLTVRAQI
jgi:hypothetical protein